MFDTFMLAQGLKQSVFDLRFDPNVYLRLVNNRVFGYIILVFYVDDILVVAKDRSEANKLNTQLSFGVKDLGLARRFLWIKIK